MLEAAQVLDSIKGIACCEHFEGEIMNTSSTLHSPSTTPIDRLDLLRPIRQWLDHFEVRSAKTAHRIAKLIPAQCPFEREVKFWGLTLVHIPPLCKLNPFYEQFVALRFRALCYLVDQCGEDIRSYC